MSQEMMYYEIYDWLEERRWDLNTDIDWAGIQTALMSDDDVKFLHILCLSEFTALDAAYMFMRDFHADVDFSLFMSVWFFEEMKHFNVLRRYLTHFGVELKRSTLETIHEELPPGGEVNTLTMHMLGEIRTHVAYIKFYKHFKEPVIKSILKAVAADELRHGHTYFRFLEKRIAADPTVTEKVLRFARFLLRDNKHPIPQFCKAAEDEIDFSTAIASFMTVPGTLEGEDRRRFMSLQWLSRLTGHKLDSLEDLGAAIRLEHRNNLAAGLEGEPVDGSASGSAMYR